MRYMGATEFRSIDPQELDEAVLRDEAQDYPSLPSPRPQATAGRARANGFAPGLRRERTL
jgi:hypothetical protein